MTNPTVGEGFVSFGNGNELIQFENIEDVILNGGSASSIALPGSSGGILDQLFGSLQLQDMDEILAT
jgi:hypothetical protein